MNEYLRNLALVASAALAATPALADWRKELGIFRVGLIEATAPPQEGRDALKRAFGKALGMPVEIVVLRDWPQLIDAQASARINYAVYSTTAYATASELCRCVEPLASPRDVDGATGVRSVVLARQGKADSLDDLPNAKVATPGEDDLTGWLTPLALLPEAGVQLKGDEGFLLKSASAAEALAQFRTGSADILFGWEPASSSVGDGLPGGTTGLAPEVDTVVLWRSPLLRYGPHAVLRSTDAEAKTILSKFLEGLNDKDPQAYDLLSQGHGGGFTPAADQDYSMVRDIVRKSARRQP